MKGSMRPLQFLLLIGIAFGCSSSGAPGRPVTVPETAVFSEGFWTWRSAGKQHELWQWNSAGGIYSYVLVQGDRAYSVAYNGTKILGVNRQGKDQYQITCHDYACSIGHVEHSIQKPDLSTARPRYAKYYHDRFGKTAKLVQAPNGNWNEERADIRFYDQVRVNAFSSDGHLESISCRVPELSWSHGTVGTPDQCGATTTYNPDGTIKKRANTGIECTAGCGEFKPFIKPGLRYVVWVKALVLRETPAATAKVLANLTENTILTILEDTQKIETISDETAPWVKVKTPDGKEGYVFGGFIRYEHWNSGKDRVDLLPDRPWVKWNK